MSAGASSTKDNETDSIISDLGSDIFSINGSIATEPSINNESASGIIIFCPKYKITKSAIRLNKTKESLA